MASGQGIQVKHCMTNKLLRDDLFCLYKEHHDFGKKEEKSETDSKRRPFYFILFYFYFIFLENTMILGRKKRNLRLIQDENFFFRQHYYYFRKKIGLRPRTSDIFLSQPYQLHINCMTSLRSHHTLLLSSDCIISTPPPLNLIYLQVVLKSV